jgi:hypothetical protein
MRIPALHPATLKCKWYKPAYLYQRFLIAMHLAAPLGITQLPQTLAPRRMARRMVEVYSEAHPGTPASAREPPKHVVV